MKVLNTCLSKSWGGMEMYSIQTALFMINSGIEVEFLCCEGSRIFNEAKKSGIVTRELPDSKYFNPLNIITTFKYIRENRYDLIHCEASKDLWYLVPALQLSRKSIPLLLTKHIGSYINKKDILHRWIYRRVNLALAISKVIKRNLMETTPLKEEEIVLLHDAIDTSRFNPDRTDGTKIRKEFGIGQNELLIGMTSRFSRGKGHEEFLYAINRIIRKYKDVKFLIVGEATRGESKYAEGIKYLADKLGLLDNVIFTGYRTDIPEILAALDIFVFPSHAEAFGLGLVEAMSMSKPSVCTNSDGVLDIAVDGVTSYLFEKENTSDLVQNIERLIDHAEKRSEFGFAARKRVLENFSCELFTEKLAGIYYKAAAH